MEIEEVLVAKIVSGGQCGSSERKTPALTSNFSVTASMMMSAAARSAATVVAFSRVDRLLALFFRQALLFHVARQSLDDPLRARFDKVLRSVEQNHVMPGAKHDVGNSMPHLARADDSDDVILRFCDWLIFRFIHKCPRQYRDLAIQRSENTHFLQIPDNLCFQSPNFLQKGVRLCICVRFLA